MAFFRSDIMKLCQMLLHKESAFDCLAELGNLGVVQFNNLNSPDHKPNMNYISELQRCTEMQRIVQHLETATEDCKISITCYPDIEDEIPKAKDVKMIEQTLQNLYTELHGVEKNHKALLKKKNHLQEKLFVLEKANEFLKVDRTRMSWSDSLVKLLIHDELEHMDENHITLDSADSKMHGPQYHHKLNREEHIQLGFFLGSISADRFQSFEVLLWRLSRGNFFLKHSEIVVPMQDIQQSERDVRKIAFVVMFQGDSIRNKILKLCQGYHVKLFECPESNKERKELHAGILKEVGDLKTVIKTTDSHRRYVLNIAANDLFLWKLRVKKTLMVYHVLNKLAAVEGVHNQHYLQAECWIPEVDVKNVRRALIRGAKRASKGEAGMLFPPILIEKHYDHHHGDVHPPTFFRLNRFTRGFQNLIDSYGIAQYQEANPAPYTIITFPFLFSVMFGDVGHGIILTIFAYWMVHFEKKLEAKNKFNPKKNEIFDLLFGGRYVLLLMGLFSIHAGFIYNDIFSKTINLFGSKWHVSNNTHELEVEGEKYMQLDPADMDYYDGAPYLFGIDPLVHIQGENSIIFMNSLKMKLAIIFGVAQMTLGLGLAAWNHMYFRNYIDLFLVCLPQTIFLLSMFGYLVLLILVKWTTYGGHKLSHQASDCAPSILITFINMILFKGPVPLPEGCQSYIYKGQFIVQPVLVFVAVLCVPVLFAGKPLAFHVQNNRIQKIIDEEMQQRQLHKTNSAIRRSLMYKADDPDEKPEKTANEEMLVNLSEVWIHQAIHCIESILGAISHTASYLRLWALSLAHSQLAHVLWKMVLAKPLQIDTGYFSGVFLYFAFGTWACLTLAILVVMEGLSAFLHTLRLHWVEFQSKFYGAEGEIFMPFSFKVK